MKCNVVAVSVCILLSLLLGAPANASEIDEATAALQECVGRHIGNEKRKANPSSRNLLTICKKELNDVLALVPPGAEINVEDFIASEIDGDLAN